MEDTSKFSYFFLGLGIGVAVGLLFAPQSGEDTRRLIRTKADEGSDYVKRRSDEALKNHAFFLEIDQPEPRITVDPAQVAEAIGLSLENAARYSPPGSEIRLLCKATAEGVSFEIHDAGPGIPPRDRQRVMEKFVRLPRNEKMPGYGLGLYIARSLVILNGGQIRLDVSPLGGTLLEIKLSRQG